MNLRRANTQAGARTVFTSIDLLWQLDQLTHPDLPHTAVTAIGHAWLRPCQGDRWAA